MDALGSSYLANHLAQRKALLVGILEQNGEPLCELAVGLPLLISAIIIGAARSVVGGVHWR